MKTLVLSFMCLFVALPSFAGPKLECAGAQFDFGTLISGAPITNTFTLVNSGNKDAVISKVKNCCGVKSVVKPMVIPAGGTATCRSIFSTQNRYGKQEKQILIATNARWKPYVELKMVGELLRPIEYEPKFFKLGELSSASEIDLVITATNMLERTVTLDSVESMVPGLKAEVVLGAKGARTFRGADSQNDGRKNDAVWGGAGVPMRRSWRIRVSRTGVLPQGTLMGRIRLNFSTGAVNVPIMGRVTPGITVTPTRIQFRSTSSKTVERLVMLRSADSFNVLSAALENVEGSAVIKKVADSVWRIKLTVEPGTIGADARLRIETSAVSSAEVMVPLTFER